MKVKEDLPDIIEAIAAIMNEKITPGPATFLATSPATTYIPVPQQLPTPRDTKSKVVRHRSNWGCPSKSIEDSDFIVLVLVRRFLNRSILSSRSLFVPNIFLCGFADFIQYITVEFLNYLIWLVISWVSGFWCYFRSEMVLSSCLIEFPLSLKDIKYFMIYFMGKLIVNVTDII